jgi:23S rRNA pseudouridine2605 synthase
MEERIQKIIANSGYCSRRKAEVLIKDGKVIVDGKVVGTGYKLEKENSSIIINGKKLKNKNKKYYFLLNKPKGILVTKDDPQKRKTIYEIPAIKKLHQKLKIKLNYVGRLDGISEGLLILTNDGELSNNLTHPSKKITKEYHLRIEPKLKKEDITKAKNGIMIDKIIFFGKIKTKKKNEFTIEITEGRNRILRRIFEDKLKYKIYMLKRIRVKDLKLKSLKIGEVRELSKNEVKDLKNY